jgi:hypothetical protein
MMDLATLTMNPTLDTACEVDRVIPTIKLRANHERYDPGGGGINVARVFVRLGGNARIYYLSGGATGVALDGLLDLHQLVRRPIRIAGQTRVSTAVHERSTGQEFRFVPAGPQIAEREWRECLSQLERGKHDYLVASGSLPGGVPDDFYARVGAIARRQGMRFVLDTSGPALAAGLAGGDVFLDRLAYPVVVFRTHVAHGHAIVACHHRAQCGQFGRRAGQVRGGNFQEGAANAALRVKRQHALRNHVNRDTPEGVARTMSKQDRCLHSRWSSIRVKNQSPVPQRLSTSQPKAMSDTTE